MAGISGPCRSLPGSVHKVPVGIECDDHPGVPATHRVQGETDSFGAEYMDMCALCYQKFRDAEDDEQKDPTPTQCDWCGKTAVCHPCRDPDEGSCGPVYDVCDACIAKMHSDAAEEMDNDLDIDGEDDPYNDFPSYDGDDDEDDIFYPEVDES